MVDYRIEVYDTWGRRIAVYDEVPLLDVARSTPDARDVIEGILPGPVTDLGHGYRIRVYVRGAWFCDAQVTRVAPQWSDSRKLILERYVRFHEVIAFEAERAARDGNVTVSGAFENRSVSSIAKSVINSALGPIHYWVAHQSYPDGARREYEKFVARKTPENELEVSGIAQGQWVGRTRMDTANAYAKDGDTIAGVGVDGAAWPDIRLLLIDAEETSRNFHGLLMHPEVASWSDDVYAASGYKFRAEAAKEALQDLILSKGIDYIELNPHRDVSGAFDDRVDAYGRYIGLVYGGGECFNAAQVERGHAAVYLWKNGQYHVPEMELKDYFSYAGVHQDSIEETPETLARFDVAGGVIEILTVLGYAANGYVWTVEPDLAVRFYKAQGANKLVLFDPVTMWVGLGSDSAGLTNVVYFEGNPITGALRKTYRNTSSINEYGSRIARLNYFSITLEEDADKLVHGLLNDLAYPEPCGFVQFYHGDAGIRLGDLVELREPPPRRLEREIDGEWDDRFMGKIVGRVRRISHRFSGRQVTTTVWLTSPLRSVANPLHFMVQSQDPASSLYQFRLDAASVGLDMGYHLD
jgi:endonuclease YncB( thermonuclease family)